MWGETIGKSVRISPKAERNAKWCGNAVSGRQGIKKVRLIAQTHLSLSPRRQHL
jgi:hypothetical protein